MNIKIEESITLILQDKNKEIIMSEQDIKPIRAG